MATHEMKKMRAAGSEVASFSKSFIGWSASSFARAQVETALVAGQPDNAACGTQYAHKDEEDAVKFA
jgi:hypothetical protein